MAKAEYRSAVRSRKLIVDALADLLQEKPLEKITVTDVVARANINRGTFYAHYRDIPDVVDHLIQQTFSSILDALVSQEDPTANIAHILLTRIQSILEDDLAFYRKILTSHAAMLMHNRLADIMEEYFLQNAEVYYRGNRQEFEVAIRFCAGGLSNLYQDWFSGKLPYSLSELTRIGEALLGRFITTSDDPESQKGVF